MKTIIDQIGNTPLIKTQNLVPKKGVELYLKLEGNNPGGSVKDRAAFNMISQAINRGDIKQGDRIVEATSGNTGIALALVSRLMKVDITLVMPENSTIERVKSMKAYGAKVILTPADQGIEGSRDLALGMVEDGFYSLNQFANEDNYGAHYKATGPEIWSATAGGVTHFVSAMGTTGTIMGVSRYLKEQNEGIRIIGAQPKDGSKIPGIRKWPEAYLPKIFDRKRVDRIIEVSETEARLMANRLAKEEGVFAGMSSGGAVAVALKAIEQIDAGIVVAIVCDRGDRYLSSDLFEQ